MLHTECNDHDEQAGLPIADSAQRVCDYLAWKVVDNDRVLLDAGLDAQARWQLSFWDSLIVAAALRSGAPLLWSEDLALAHGQHDGVHVMNPLRVS